MTETDHPSPHSFCDTHRALLNENVGGPIARNFYSSTRSNGQTMLERWRTKRSQLLYTYTRDNGNINARALNAANSTTAHASAIAAALQSKRKQNVAHEGIVSK